MKVPQKARRIFVVFFFPGAISLTEVNTGMELAPGLTGTCHMAVRVKDTAQAQGSGEVPVLSTPRMVALMEAAAVACVRGRLPAGHTSVGVKLDVEHIAATPPGMEVRAVAKLVAVEGRRLVFEVEARDEIEVIGRGTHVRVVVEETRFLEKTLRKWQACEGD
ncbi:MAG: thioesterase family protein [Desulfotomaculales bacterium]